MVLKRAGWNLWIACLFVVCFQGWVELLEVTVGSTSVKVARGQTAVLPCTFKTSAALNQLNVIWTVTPRSNANQPEQVILYQGGQVISGASHFNSRVGFVITMPSLSASIFINNSQLSDTGTYQCLVNNPPDRGERNIGVLGLSVLDKVQGTLILRNISTAINGLYQCTVTNVMGSHKCAIDLQVIEPQLQHVGIIAGAVITGILVLLLGVIFVIIVLFYRRSKNKYEEEEIPNEIREDDIPPSASIKGFHPDDSSENDTLASANTYSAHYWQRKNPTYESNMFNRYNGHMHHSINISSRQPQSRTLYMNGSQHTIPKTVVITTSSSPSSQNLARYNDSLVRKTPPPLPHSYTVSHANLQRMGGIPVMIPAQNRAGSLV
ncbi:immunoglobulin superfamily member 11 isoform X2 [Hypanus sabinus]|uniref:immunoglobulin superfamily member 11 isoform X2 n=1 Tax=Hypanus sabinus TaxID=79690 RepID=UPI0028C379F2|nr:immunoglobulin superfamily member 11 isoform X2 [Hypanus sabinus]